MFHEGELAVQEQVGVQYMASRVGRGIKSTIPSIAAHFLQAQPFIIVASTDLQGYLWASILSGEPSFMTVLDEQTLHINALPMKGDPLLANLSTTQYIGSIAIEFESRRRMRLNGSVELLNDGFLIYTEEVYSNCPKYIQARVIKDLMVHEDIPNHAEVMQARVTKKLSTEQIEWIRQADTFFIASAHIDGRADASHRGGNKGFVHVEDNGRLIWPDYAGNMMYNTLGNIATNSHVGLLFLDFERNRSLQLTGLAEIIWDQDQISQYAGAERLVAFEPIQIIEQQNAFPFSWEFQSFSSANPTE